MRIRILYLIVACFLGANFSNAWAEGNRIRLQIPLSMEGFAGTKNEAEVEFEEDLIDDDDLDDESAVSGFGITYVFNFGLGIGWSSINVNIEQEDFLDVDGLDVETTEEGNFVEVSYTFGDMGTFTAGVGLLVSGKSKFEVNEGFILIDDESVDDSTTKVSGTTYFFGGGYTFDNAEVFAQYRIIQFKSEHEHLEITTDSNQLWIGAGFVF